MTYTDLGWGRTVPAAPDFAALAARRKVVPVVRRLLADAETPLGVYRKLADAAGGFLLESADHTGLWSRYSFIGRPSGVLLTEDAGRAHWVGDVPTALPRTGEVTQVLHESVRWLAEEPLPGLPPFTGGLVGSLGYDIVRQWEKVPDNGRDALGLPGLAVFVTTEVAVVDHFDGSLLLIVNVLVPPEDPDWDAAAAYADAVDRLDAMTALLDAAAPSTVSAVGECPQPLSSSHTRDEFEQMVAAAKEAICAGEVFQVVVSQRFCVPCTADALDVYRALRAANPSPYMYLLRVPAIGEHPAYDIVGSSPEVLLTVTGQRVITHPIAGSRPRGHTPDEDLALGEELLADDKERAEHLMLVDLSRNDLQRVCQPGSVETVEFMTIRRYSHVMHLESTVVGELRPGTDAYEALAATFPAGTLSGAPKPRAMALIDELEGLRRGVYAGVVGYFSFSGDLDMAIAIRTAVITGGQAHVQAGAGIVAASDPAAEYEETRAKAAAALRAVAVAHGMRSARGESDETGNR